MLPCKEYSDIDLLKFSAYSELEFVLTFFFTAEDAEEELVLIGTSRTSNTKDYAVLTF